MRRGVETAEMKRSGEWITIRAIDALGLREPMLRCSACHGRVIVAGDYAHGGRFYFVHRKAHAGCGHTTSGASARHPEAVA